MWTQTSTTANQGQIMIVSSKYLYTFTMGQKRDKNIHRLFTRYEMVSLSLHETNPGHHLQGSYSIEQADWPMFRKVMLLTTLMALCSFWENCGLFPCLMFSTDHGGQNIQPSALQVPHQHWLCRGEKPLCYQLSINVEKFFRAGLCTVRVLDTTSICMAILWTGIKRTQAQNNGR